MPGLTDEFARPRSQKNQDYLDLVGAMRLCERAYYDPHGTALEMKVETTHDGTGLMLLGEYKGKFSTVICSVHDHKNHLEIWVRDEPAPHWPRMFTGLVTESGIIPMFTSFAQRWGIQRTSGDYGVTYA